MEEIMFEQEVADMLRLDIKTISRLRRMGEPVFPYVAIGSSIRYSRSVVLAEFSKWPADSDGKARNNNPAGKTTPARGVGRPRKSF
jgi:hypothetical protein